MEKISRFMEEKLLPVAGLISTQRHLCALRDGGSIILMLMMVGSLFLIISNPPVEFLADMVEPYAPALNRMVYTTFGVSGLLASFGISFALATSYKLDGLSSAGVGVGAFLLANPLTADNNIDLTLMGSKGYFVAMILSFFVVEMLRFFDRRNIRIKMPAGVPPAVAQSFSALIPAICILSFIWLVNQFLANFETSIPALIDQLVTKPLVLIGGSFVSALMATFFTQIIWSFGLHGDMIVTTFVGPAWDVMSLENAMAKVAGLEPPHSISNQIWEIFVNNGGSGATLALVFLMLTKARSAHLKMIGRTAFWPGIFNINEPVIFGLPIVLNPIMVIPFIICPMLNMAVSYLCFELGLVSKTYASVPWTTPVLFSGFLSTGDWKASLLQLFNLIMCGLVYYPFFRIVDNQRLREEQQVQ
ncbi:MAG: PTS sugar transporter subunit IIC [Negativicutes bacterium]|nr:PTS sugar transporter subunit IIC [Negativicutes bacterium]